MSGRRKWARKEEGRKKGDIHEILYYTISLASKRIGCFLSEPRLGAGCVWEGKEEVGVNWASNFRRCSLDPP